MDRNEEITKAYLELLDRHLDDLVNERVNRMLALREIAGELCLSHKNLIAIINTTRNNHPCHFYDYKILEKAKQLLDETDWPVAKIALRLTYDPSNFSKFFKKYTGETPGQFRHGNRV